MSSKRSTLRYANIGALDVCYANAGISGGIVPLQEQTAELWSKILRSILLEHFWR